MPWRLLAAALLLLLPEGLQAESAPSVRPRVEVAGATVRVSDLLAAPLPAALKRYADTPVFQAPLPGKNRFVPGRFLVQKLSLLAGGTALGLRAPSRVSISRKGQYLKDTRLLPLLEQASRATWSGPVTLTEVRVVGRRTLPMGPLTLTPDKKRLRIRKNRIELPVAISMGGEAMGRLTLTAEVNITKKVVVATQAIRQGEVITPAHITLAPRPVPPTDHDVLCAPELAVGLKSTRPIRSGTILTELMVKAPPLVEKGEGVRILYTLKGLVITATGIAGETGGLGEYITVRNCRSGKRVTCRITGAHSVEPLL